VNGGAVSRDNLGACNSGGLRPMARRHLPRAVVECIDRRVLEWPAAQAKPAPVLPLRAARPGA
jgi:hypothetical protein